ncbi:hypothetical protein BCS87_24405 [Vibrio splendidus]|nr:hypothetical protein [Vibrio breoganii]PMO34432.1 hypothetical protein BCT12_13920 [Vibrio breoganii]PMP42008.1 hypothetical protein BCS87_24405 [Vibrio splendidus]
MHTEQMIIAGKEITLEQLYKAHEAGMKNLATNVTELEEIQLTIRELEWEVTELKHDIKQQEIYQ